MSVEPPVTPGDPAPESAPAREPASTRAPGALGAWSVLLRALRPQASASHLLTGLLCAVLGFALVVQMQHTQAGGLASLRQSDLVQLLEETTDRSRELRERVTELEKTRDELASGTNQQQAALDAATQRAATQGVLSGRLPAVGPGVVLTVRDPGRTVSASTYVTILTELRNAGAEAVQLAGQRITAETFFLDGPDGVLVDGVLVADPARWDVIGDSHTIAQALEIPGGALALVRSQGAEAEVTSLVSVEVTATRSPREPRFASPAPTQG